jgi:hypothetical protein
VPGGAGIGAERPEPIPNITVQTGKRRPSALSLRSQVAQASRHRVDDRVSGPIPGSRRRSASPVPTSASPPTAQTIEIGANSQAGRRPRLRRPQDRFPGSAAPARSTRPGRTFPSCATFWSDGRFRVNGPGYHCPARTKRAECEAPRPGARRGAGCYRGRKGLVPRRRGVRSPKSIVAKCGSFPRHFCRDAVAERTLAALAGGEAMTPGRVAAKQGSFAERLQRRSGTSPRAAMCRRPRAATGSRPLRRPSRRACTEPCSLALSRSDSPRAGPAYSSCGAWLPRTRPLVRGTACGAALWRRPPAGS